MEFGDGNRSSSQTPGQPPLAKGVFWVLLISSPLPALPARAQDDGSRVVRLTGRAGILSAGTWREAKTGERLAPGEAIRSLRGGEASVKAAEGLVEATVRAGGSLSYMTRRPVFRRAFRQTRSTPAAWRLPSPAGFDERFWKQATIPDTPCVKSKTVI
jgi:hypothetical protein